MKLLTKNQAFKKLNKTGIGRIRFERLLNSGQIQSVYDGSSYLIPDWSLEQWLNHTQCYPQSFSLEEESTTCKSQRSSTDKEYSFEKARTQRTENKLKNMPLNVSNKLWKMPNLEQTLAN